MAIRGHQRQSDSNIAKDIAYIEKLDSDIESSGHLGEVLLKDGHDSTEHLCAIRCTQIRQMCTQMPSDALRDGHDSTEHRDVVDAF